MTNSYVLMTAMPPTKGHLDLIRFAASLGGQVRVIVNTQPEEPLGTARYRAVKLAVKALEADIVVEQYNVTLPQEPEEAPGFWDMWGGILSKYGFQPGDRIVASELYGVRLAEEVGGQFYPYDIDRQIRHTKATEVREDFMDEWDQIIPEFRTMIQKRVTIFGAESTGKTTLTSDVQANWSPYCNSIFEWARPYLEAVGPMLTTQKMKAIAEGQKALQLTAQRTAVKPILVQDTDLYSTLGYWQNWSSATVPELLDNDAFWLRSDLYLVTKSNIPFEPDPLRYGVDKRELSDDYWIKMLEDRELPYKVLQGQTRHDRLFEASDYIEGLTAKNPLEFKRSGKEYGNAR